MIEYVVSIEIQPPLLFSKVLLYIYIEGPDDANYIEIRPLSSFELSMNVELRI